MGMEGMEGMEGVDATEAIPGTTQNAVAPTGASRVTNRTQTHTLTEVVMLDTRIVTWSLAVFAAISFIVCVVYGLVAPESLHMPAFLEQALPGFRWLTLPGLLIGLVEAFLYGAYAGIVFPSIYNALWRRASRS